MFIYKTWPSKSEKLFTLFVVWNRPFLYWKLIKHKKKRLKIKWMAVVSIRNNLNFCNILVHISIPSYMISKCTHDIILPLATATAILNNNYLIRILVFLKFKSQKYVFKNNKYVCWELRLRESKFKRNILYIQHKHKAYSYIKQKKNKRIEEK